MNFGEATTLAAKGQLIRRPHYSPGGHLRVFRPLDLPEGTSPEPTLRLASGWPYAVSQRHPFFTAADLLATDWEICPTEDAMKTRDSYDSEGA